MPRLAVVNSNNVSLIIAAIPITDGRGDPFVSVEADEDQYTTDGTSADGHTIRAQTNNQLYTVTITLKGSSEHNAQLSALHAIDATVGNGSGIGGFFLEDGDGSTLMASDKCWLKKLAPKEFGVTPSDVVWEAHVMAPVGTMIVGGN